MIRHTFPSLLLCMLLCIAQSVFAQISDEESEQRKEKVRTDSTTIRFEHEPKIQIVSAIKYKNPKVASWLSAAIPGAGQLYNERAWKLPIIYGAFTTTIFLTIDYNNRYLQYKELYLELDALPTAERDANQLERTKDGMKFYTRYRDMNIIATVLIYVLQIVDASVDAHLSNFDVNDNLTRNLQPCILQDEQRYAMGVKYTLRF